MFSKEYTYSLKVFLEAFENIYIKKDQQVTIEAWKIIQHAKS